MNTLDPTSSTMVPRHSGRARCAGLRLTMATKYSAKLQLASSMNTMAIHSSVGD
jgi:hypothetical protein